MSYGNDSLMGNGHAGSAPAAGNGLIRERGSTDAIVWALRSEPGEVRPHNEDFAATKPPLFMVADGLGGHDGGEVASRIAAHTVIDSWSEASYPLSQAMRSSLRKANAAVFGAAYEYNHQGMATTITALALDGSAAVIAHVGDSRAYLVRNGRAEQLTNDHSQVAEMLRRGLLTPEQAASHPARSVLTRCVGLTPAVSVDIMRRPFLRGDIFILCTDGLWDMVSRQEIGEISAGLSTESSPSDIEKIVDQMVDTALERGAADNVTAVVVLAIESSPPVNPPSGGLFRRWMHR